MKEKVESYIFHIDLDSFFVSVGRLYDSSLVGVPVVVAGLDKRSVVGSASYEARKLGIHAAMPVFKVISLHPNVRIVDHNFSRYIKYSKIVLEILQTFSKKIEVGSIDEAYIDVSHIVNSRKEAFELAFNIQKKVFSQTGLSSSFGISNFKYLAKIAANIKKPMGLYEIYSDEIYDKLWDLNISELNGVGKNLQNELASINIKSIRDLATYSDVNYLANRFGKHMYRLHQEANATFHDFVDTSKNQAKAMSVSRTFFQNTTNIEDLKFYLKNVCDELWERLKSDSLIFKRISLTLKTKNFINYSRSKTYDSFISNKNSLLKLSNELLEELFESMEASSYRLLGVSVSQLVNQNQNYFQPNLTQSLIIDKKMKEDLQKTILSINRKFNKKVLYFSNKVKI